MSVERIQELFDQESWWLDRAGIDERQQLRIAAFLEASAPGWQEIAAERDELRRELIEALSAPATDRDRIEELRWRATEVAGRALEAGFEVAAELGEVLTPEQRRDLVRHWEERR